MPTGRLYNDNLIGVVPTLGELNLLQQSKSAKLCKPYSILSLFRNSMSPQFPTKTCPRRRGHDIAHQSNLSPPAAPFSPSGRIGGVSLVENSDNRAIAAEFLHTNKLNGQAVYQVSLHPILLGHKVTFDLCLQYIR